MAPLTQAKLPFLKKPSSSSSSSSHTLSRSINGNRLMTPGAAASSPARIVNNAPPAANSGPSSSSNRSSSGPPPPPPSTETSSSKRRASVEDVEDEGEPPSKKLNGKRRRVDTPPPEQSFNDGSEDEENDQTVNKHILENGSQLLTNSFVINSKADTKGWDRDLPNPASAPDFTIVEGRYFVLNAFKGTNYYLWNANQMTPSLKVFASSFVKRSGSKGVAAGLDWFSEWQVGSLKDFFIRLLCRIIAGELPNMEDFEELKNSKSDDRMIVYLIAIAGDNQQLANSLKALYIGVTEQRLADRGRAHRNGPNSSKKNNPLYSQMKETSAWTHVSISVPVNSSHQIHSSSSPTVLEKVFEDLPFKTEKFKSKQEQTFHHVSSTFILSVESIIMMLANTCKMNREARRQLFPEWSTPDLKYTNTKNGLVKEWSGTESSKGGKNSQLFQSQDPNYRLNQIRNESGDSLNIERARRAAAGEPASWDVSNEVRLSDQLAKWRVGYLKAPKDGRWEVPFPYVTVDKMIETAPNETVKTTMVEFKAYRKPRNFTIPINAQVGASTKFVEATMQRGGDFPVVSQLVIQSHSVFTSTGSHPFGKRYDEFGKIGNGQYLGIRFKVYPQVPHPDHAFNMTVPRVIKREQDRLYLHYFLGPYLDWLVENLISHFDLDVSQATNHLENWEELHANHRGTEDFIVSEGRSRVWDGRRSDSRFPLTDLGANIRPPKASTSRSNSNSKSKPNPKSSTSKKQK